VFGLALGGGGVRGLAHLGVLRVLERSSLVPEVICGTSVGAIIAGATASGLTADQMVDIALRLRWNELIRPRLRRNCVFETSGFEDFLSTIITARDFDQLHMSFAAVARDKMTGRRVVLKEGDPVRAVAASAAIRHAFPPVRVDGRWLVDGIRVDPVPVGVARDLGATYVVGVDVVRMTAIRRWRSRSRSNVGSKLAPQSVADVAIRPALGRRGGWDFSLAQELIALGESAAHNALPMIGAALQLSPKPPSKSAA
jgi:NTE family protein